MDITIRAQPEIRTAAISHTGPYPQIGETFGTLFQWARSAGLYPQPASADIDGIAIYYDNPMVTPPDDLRSDACFVVPADFHITGNTVRELIVAPGTYAVTLFVGPYTEIGSAWQEFMSHGLLQSSHHPDYDRPCVEIYLDDSNLVPAEQLRTELLIPVKG